VDLVAQVDQEAQKVVALVLKVADPKAPVQKAADQSEAVLVDLVAVLEDHRQPNR
jgi:hypothetical protein